MARTIKKEMHDSKRNDILDTALQLLYSKGYEDMSLQDLVNELKISKGALYHYFDSKQTILSALISRLTMEAQTAILPIVENPKLSAIQKLQGYMNSSALWKSERKELIIGLMRMWYDEKNFVVRQKFITQSVPQTARIIEPVIRQGIKEKVFTTHFPEQVSVLFAQISFSTSETIVNLILSADGDMPTPKITMQLKAYIDVVERMLGVKKGSLKIPYVKLK